MVSTSKLLLCGPLHDLRALQRAPPDPARRQTPLRSLQRKRCAAEERTSAAALGGNNGSFARCGRWRTTACRPCKLAARHASGATRGGSLGGISKLGLAALPRGANGGRGTLFWRTYMQTV